jgi:hypothetical protein
MGTSPASRGFALARPAADLDGIPPQVAGDLHRRDAERLRDLLVRRASLLHRHRLRLPFRPAGVEAGHRAAPAPDLALRRANRGWDNLRGRHLLAHSLSVRCGPRFAASLRSWCGVIPHRLRQLEGASFDRLYHGVSRLGIVCHDLSTRRPRYFGTGVDPTVTLSEAVRASASIPRLFPAVSVCPDGEALYLTDGGLSDRYL